MACENWRSKLQAFLDRELSASDAAAVREHVRQCPDCAAEALDIAALKRGVAIAATGVHSAPAELRSKINAMVAPPRPKASWVSKAILAPALVVLLLSLGVTLFVVRARSDRNRTYSELTDMHVSALASATQVDVVSSDRHTVKPWFEGKIPFSFNLPELQGTDFTLVGGRLVYFGQSPGAQLIYRLRKHELSVFIFQDREAHTNVFSAPISAYSFQVENWSKNGLRYYIVGDVGPQDIESLSKLLRDAA